MKNKKKTYVLLILVIGVWGTIAFKIITGLDPELPETIVQQNATIKDFKITTTVDKFSITIAERDPFLGTVLKKKGGTSLKKRKLTVSWKPVKYLGIVKSNNKNQNVFIIEINGNQCLLKKGQMRDSIVLVSGNKKRITLKYRNNVKTFSRKEQL
nr:hypothetical protein [uncultured Psychroserpens sp.]